MQRAIQRRAAHWLAAGQPAIVSSWARTQLDAARLARYEIAGVTPGAHDAIIAGHTRPLVNLLRAFVRSGESRYRDVYLDERLRFAPHRADPATRAAFFREVLPADEDAVIQALPTELAGDVAGLLRELHAPLLDVSPTPPIRVLALGDCLLNEVRVFLGAECRRAGLAVDMRNLYFSAAMDRGLDVGEAARFLEQNPSDVVALSFMTYEGIPAYRSFCREVISGARKHAGAAADTLVALIEDYTTSLRAHTDAVFLLHNASGLPLGRWRRRIPLVPALPAALRDALSDLNTRIADVVARTPGTLLVDEAALATTNGRRASERPVIERRIARDAFFHTTQFGRTLSTEYAGVLRSFDALRRTKVVLVDFDNTLWDGVMADGPVTHHHERQLLLRRLREAGILLVAVSKNDPANIRWDEMRLSPDDFVLSHIGWNHKVANIRATAETLALGLDAFTFVDDSAQEREFVRTQIPEVRILDAHDDFAWRSLERLLAFPASRLTDESRLRTTIYREQAARRSAIAGQVDTATMMATLELTIAFGRARGSDLDRLAELVQRTNQFNTTTIRHTKPELRALMASDAHRIYVGTMADKFGTLGLVAAAIVERRDSTVVLDGFVMSCRAMGFQLERAFLRLLLDAESGASQVVGHLVPTGRNLPAMGLYGDCGFSEGGAGEWTLDASAPRPSLPSWFSVIARD